MLSTSFRRLACPTVAPCTRRLFSEGVLQSPGAHASSAGPTQLVRYPYAVPRNTNGNLPVYTDIRNGGTRYMVLIRNIDGDVQALERDLRETLFEKASTESLRMKTQVVRSKHLVLTGGEWKNTVMEWLKRKGF